MCEVSREKGTGKRKQAPELTLVTARISGIQGGTGTRSGKGLSKNRRNRNMARPRNCGRGQPQDSQLGERTLSHSWRVIRDLFWSSDLCRGPGGEGAGQQQARRGTNELLRGEIVFEKKEELILKQARRCPAGGKLFFLERMVSICL